jgi:phosphohistidine swiveling domain-containing protein
MRHLGRQGLAGVDSSSIALWLPLDGRGADVSAVGGKGASLDRLVGYGMPVPRAAVLTTSAYQAFVAAAGDDFQAPLPAALAEALESVYAHVSGGGPVAVRSSAIAEDLPSASFAGQYVSCLNVDHDGLEQAVRSCWASLWSPGVAAYRSAKGLSGSETAMAVVIQSMVDAEQSGVLFTVDPVAPDTACMRVEVVDGFGEALVSGAATPAVFHLGRHDASPAERDAPAFLRELGRLAAEIERREGRPQDVEWSVAAGTVNILQARPITAQPPTGRDGFDTPPAAGVTYTPAGVGEMLPGVLPPLVWTTNAPMLEEAFASLFRRLGIRPPLLPQPMIGRFRGRAALNLSLLKAAARQMPRGSGAEIERQYLGRVLGDRTDEGTPSLRLRMRRARSAIMALRLQKHLPAEAEVFLEAADLALDLRSDLASASPETLVSYRRELRRLAGRGVVIEAAVSASAAANFSALEAALERWLGPQEAALAAQSLTAGSTRDQAGGCGTLLALWDIHCEHCQDPDVARAVYEGPVEDTGERLRAVGGHGVAFLELVEDTLRRAGCRAVYAGPMWDEDRDAFWSLLRRCRGAHDTPSAVSARVVDDAATFLADLDVRLRRSRKWRTTRILTGQIVDVRWRLLRRMIADARTFLSLREEVKAALLRFGGEERRVVRELTRRLVAAGALGADGDEWLLSDGELESLALGREGPGTDVIERRRRAWSASREEPPLPELFAGIPLVWREDVPEIGEGALRGWAASPGRVTGRALVVADVVDAHRFSPGEILVGHSTDPSWTPLFLTAGGIVMEQGGPLSHAAIVAREFGVPAVLNVKGATRQITTGMAITVDGTLGTVEIERNASEEAA